MAHQSCESSDPDNARYISWRGAAVLLACLVLSFIGPTQAADLDIAIAAGDAPDRLWARELKAVFERHVGVALNGSTTSINWRLIGGELDSEPGAELDLVKSGQAQLAQVSISRHPWSLYPQNISFATPFSCSDPVALASANDRLNAGFASLDLAWASLDLVYLGGGFAHGPYVLVTAFPVGRFEDLKGKRLSAPELALDWMRGTGANALAGDGETFRVGLATGKIDGVITHAAEAERLGLDHDAPHITDVGFGSIFEGGLVANRAWFDNLRPTVQAALRDAASAYGRTRALEQRGYGTSAIDVMVARGATYNDLSDSDRRFWVGQLPDLAGDWAYELDVRNMAGTDMLTSYSADLSQNCGAPLRDWTAVTGP